MSPLMFLLIVEGLSRLTNKETTAGKTHGIKIARILRITHLLFIDDAVLYGRGTIEEWDIYKELLELFCSAF